MGEDTRSPTSALSATQRQHCQQRQHSRHRQLFCKEHAPSSSLLTPHSSLLTPHSSRTPLPRSLFLQVWSQYVKNVYYVCMYVCMYVYVCRERARERETLEKILMIYRMCYLYRKCSLWERKRDFGEDIDDILAGGGHGVGACVQWSRPPCVQASPGARVLSSLAACVQSSPGACVLSSLPAPPCLILIHVCVYV